MYIGFYVKYLLFLLDLNNVSFLDMFAKDTQVSNFMKIVQWKPSCTMPVEGQT